jgi:hypothetical protein
VITGFNTDIEHNGVVYHVQTEDKGLDSPIILSLVYVGGAILASKRAPYEDLIAEGFSDEALSERLKRQHKLICAAINSGRIDDLKKMTARASEAAHATPSTIEVETTPPVEEVGTADENDKGFVVIEEGQAETEETETIIAEPAEVETETVAPAVLDEFEFESVSSQTWIPPEKLEPPPPVEEPPPPAAPVVVEKPHHQAYTVHDSRGHLETQEAPLGDGLQIIFLDDAQFYSGESRTLRVLVMNRQGQNEKPVSGTSVSIKILGTGFRPLIYSLKTDRDGVATVNTQIPNFTSGRAAVLVRVATKEQAAELRRVIHPNK